MSRIVTLLYQTLGPNSERKQVAVKQEYIGVMARLELLSLASLVVLTTASTLQLPLRSEQPGTTVVEHARAKPLVDSASLQAKIDRDNLFSRAKKLFQIAELGTEEYDHPTRVIGSKGMCP